MSPLRVKRTRPMQRPLVVRDGCGSRPPPSLSKPMAERRAQNVATAADEAASGGSLTSRCGRPRKRKPERGEPLILSRTHSVPL